MADNGAVDDDLEPADDTPGAMTQDSPGTINAKAQGASIIQVEMGASKHLLLILWLSSFISALAVAGLVATCLFIYKNIGYTAVLEYDLMDLRAKVGEAHENTPEVEE